jgi:hypothetical protein
MSAKATFWAWRQQLKSSSKLVLLCLSNNHNEDTDRCDPGPAYMSEMTGLNVKTIRAALKSLQEGGILTSHHRQGRSPMYAFNWSAGDLFKSSVDPKTTLPEIGYTQNEPYPDSDDTLPEIGEAPYPDLTLPEIGYTQNEPYPDSDGTLPKNGLDPTQIRVPNLKESKKNLRDIYIDFSLSEISSDFDQETIKKYINHRKNKNPDFSKDALDRILETAQAVKNYPRKCLTPNQVIQKATDSGWISLEIKWFSDQTAPQSVQKNTGNTVPSWQAKGFKNVEDWQKYYALVSYYRNLELIPEPQRTPLQQSELEKTIKQLKDLKPQRAAA